MTIEQMIIRASKHLTENFSTVEAIRKLLAMYRDECTSITAEELYISAVMTSSNPAKFFVWYYNKFITTNRSQGFNAEMMPENVDAFTETRIRPVRLVVDGTKRKTITCDPDDAHYWVIEIKGPAGFSIVAEALNQDAAQDMETFIHKIGRHYQQTI